MLNARLTEELAQLANIPPQQAAVGSVTTSWVSVKNTITIMAIINTGAFGASATVDATLQQATNAAGANAKAINGKALNQLVAASGANKQALINLRPQELDTNGGFSFIQLSVTIGVAATYVAADLMAHLRYETDDAYNQAAVVQILP